MSDFNGPSTEMRRVIENRCEIRRLEVENSYLQKCMNSLHAKIERKDEAIKAAIKLLRKWNDSQALQILNKALSTKEDSDD